MPPNTSRSTFPCMPFTLPRDVYCQITHHGNDAPISGFPFICPLFTPYWATHNPLSPLMGDQSYRFEVEEFMYTSGRNPTSSLTLASHFLHHPTGSLWEISQSRARSSPAFMSPTLFTKKSASFTGSVPRAKWYEPKRIPRPSPVSVSLIHRVHLVVFGALWNHEIEENLVPVDESLVVGDVRAFNHTFMPFFWACSVFSLNNYRNSSLIFYSDSRFLG